ncbi:MAG TPA: hypothetical protein VFB63_26445 [Bryobacteraceae bacterium]|jgi:hypothetical protein|nr:hypothetical protein [Bryobacteraceae bacterium]
MIRFDQLIRPGMTIREVKQSHIETIPVFDSLGFRPSCEDCALEVAALRAGMQVRDLLDALNSVCLTVTE